MPQNLLLRHPDWLWLQGLAALPSAESKMVTGQPTMMWIFPMSIQSGLTWVRPVRVDFWKWGLARPPAMCWQHRKSAAVSRVVADFRVLHGPKLFRWKLIRWESQVRRNWCWFIAKQRKRLTMQPWIWQPTQMLQWFLWAPTSQREEKNPTVFQSPCRAIRTNW